MTALLLGNCSSSFLKTLRRLLRHSSGTSAPSLSELADDSGFENVVTDESHERAAARSLPTASQIALNVAPASQIALIRGESQASPPSSLPAPRSTVGA
jgi:hypothetical protein